MAKNIPDVVFVLGGPGAGKGTQCLKIQDAFSYYHLSAGDCLREERAKKGSAYGELIEEHIRQGSIVPVRITLTLLLKKMVEKGWWNKKFLIDGFPRNEDNLSGWKDTIKAKELRGVISEISKECDKACAESETCPTLKEKKLLCTDISSFLEKEKDDSDGVNVRFCLFFDCDEDTMAKRIMIRAQDSGRSDDNAESMRKRFQTYQKETLPIINHYRECQKLQSIDADKSVDDVFSEVCKISW